MYHAYFGIEESPFSITPDPRYLYMSRGHQEALALLVYGVSESGGFVLLTGEVGTGKTSVCRCLLEQLPDTADVALILNPRLNALELLATICDELGVAHPEDTNSLKVLVDLLNEHLLAVHAKGRHAVVIIDEAQNLSPEVLEQVRLLTNLETAKRKLLQIILIGQPELSDLLNRKEMRQLVQRITARYHLQPLDRAETRAYIQHRLAVGGLVPDLFDRAANNALYRYSRGIPRLINSLCERCLLGAYVQGRKDITRSIVRQAAAEVLGKVPGRLRLGRAAVPAIAAPVLAVLALFIIDQHAPDLLARLFDWESGRDEVASDNSTRPSIGATRISKAVQETAIQGRGGAARPAVAEPAGPSTSADAAPAVEPDPKTVDVTVNYMKISPVAGGTLHEADAAGPGEAVDPPSAEPDATERAERISPQSPTENQIDQADWLWEDDFPGPDESTELETDGTTKLAALRDTAHAGFSEGWTIDELFDYNRFSVDFKSSMMVLFDLWSLDFRQVDPSMPCAVSTNGGLKCIFGKASWQTVVGFNRPVLITLTDPAGRRANAVVLAVDGDRVILAVREGRISTNVDSVMPLWAGDYLVLWRPPSVYRRMLALGAKGRDVAWLKNRLAKIYGEPASMVNKATFDLGLYEKVIAFQKSRGLDPDGVVGAQTMIHLNTSAEGSDLPLLYNSGL